MIGDPMISILQAFGIKISVYFSLEKWLILVCLPFKLLRIEKTPYWKEWAGCKEQIILLQICGHLHLQHAQTCEYQQMNTRQYHKPHWPQKPSWPHLARPECCILLIQCLQSKIIVRTFSQHSIYEFFGKGSVIRDT